LVEKYPPGIVAVFDYKLSGSLDSVSFAEVIAYNAFLDWGVPVYIVWSQEPFDRFTIQKFKSGDWKPDPPIVDLDTLLLDVPAETFEEWEANLRRVYRKGIKLVA